MIKVARLQAKLDKLNMEFSLQEMLGEKTKRNFERKVYTLKEKNRIAMGMLEEYISTEEKIALEFSPKAIKAVIEEMIAAGLELKPVTLTMSDWDRESGQTVTVAVKFNKWFDGEKIFEYSDLSEYHKAWMEITSQKSIYTSEGLWNVTQGGELEDSRCLISLEEDKLDFSKIKGF
jgi:hypothetical protein